MPDSRAEMSLREAIEGRRAVRDYAAAVPDDATLEALLHAAVRAPTALHEEPWRFAVVRDRGLLRRVSEHARALLAAQPGASANATAARFVAPDFQVFYNAPALIVIGAAAPGRFVEADCWLAAQNLMLAAYALGLGSCVIGLAVDALNGEAMRQLLGLPPDFVAVAPVIVGTPAPGEGTAPTPRRPPHVVLWR